MAIVLLAFVPAEAAGQRDDAPSRTLPCDGPGADPWVTEFRDRMVSGDELVADAIDRYGEPGDCRGLVTGEFDGEAYGMVTLSFTGDVTVEAEVMPPETSIVTYSSTGGFEDQPAMRALLGSYAAGIGLEIDWEIPTFSTESGGYDVETYWDPEPGLNASASLIFRDGRLVAVRLSMAL